MGFGTSCGTQIEKKMMTQVSDWPNMLLPSEVFRVDGWPNMLLPSEDFQVDDWPTMLLSSEDFQADDWPNHAPFEQKFFQG